MTTAAAIVRRLLGKAESLAEELRTRQHMEGLEADRLQSEVKTWKPY
jgi:hypothetical protein